MSSTRRETWMDAARGIGIILVVLGHIQRGLVEPGIMADAPWSGWLDFTIYSFHMPLFFVLSGLHVRHSLARGTHRFVVSKLWTVAYPYVLWSLLQGSVTLLLAHDVNRPIHAADLLRIWYQPVGQFWFLYALLICHLLAATLSGRRGLLIAIAVVGFAVYTVLPERPDMAKTLHSLPFYLVGVYADRAILQWKPRMRGRWPASAGLWAGFAVAIAAAGLWFGRDAQQLSALPATCLGIAAVVVTAKLLHGRVARVLGMIGLMSMTIFVLHVMVGAAARIIMLDLHVPRIAWIYLMAGSIAAIGIPCVAHVIGARLGLLPLLGLAPPKPPRDPRAGHNAAPAAS